MARFTALDLVRIAELADTKDPRLIQQSTIDLARDLGLEVIAEGVETERTLRLFRQLGCDEAQGYFIAKPLTTSDRREWLARATACLPSLP